MDGFCLAQDQHGLASVEHGLKPDIHVHLGGRGLLGVVGAGRQDLVGERIADPEDVDVVFAPDVELSDAVAAPAGRDIDLVDAVAVGEVDVVGDAVGAEADRGPDAQLALRKDDLGGAVAEQEFLLPVAGRPGNDDPGPELIQGKGRLEGTEEVVSDRNDADVVVFDTE